MDLVVAALGSLVSHGADELVVSGGGEPLLHPEIGILIRFLAEISGVERRLYTNGSLIHRVEGIESAFDYVRVSMDAGGARNYAHVHGTSERSYREILISLATLADRGVNTGVSAVVHESDEESIARLLLDCERFGVPRLFLKPRMRGFSHDAMPSFALLMQSSRVEITVRAPFKSVAVDAYHLHATPSLAAMNAFIGADAKYFPCCHLTGEDWSFGHLGDDSSSIFGGQLHQNVLNRYWEFAHPCLAHDSLAYLSSGDFIQKLDPSD